MKISILAGLMSLAFVTFSEAQTIQEKYNPASVDLSINGSLAEGLSINKVVALSFNSKSEPENAQIWYRSHNFLDHGLHYGTIDCLREQGHLTTVSKDQYAFETQDSCRRALSKMLHASTDREVGVVLLLEDRKILEINLDNFGRIRDCE